MSYASAVLQRKFGLGQQYDPNALAYFSAAGITPASATPTAYDQAATFNGTNQYLSITSNSSLQVAGTSFTFAGWVNIPTGTSASEIIGKWANVYEYLIYWTGTQIGFYASNPSYSVAITIPTNQWIYVVAWYDLSLQTMNIQYNNGSVASSSNTIGFLSSTTALSIAHNLDITSPTYLNCSQAGWGFWKRVLTSNERTALYNAGNGLTYSGIQQAGLSSNLVSYWELNENSGASLYYDSVTSTGNNLTPYNTPTNSVGPIATATASSQSLINTFVKGIKGLGLWNSMVCWPLRSSQNASSGYSALALGGVSGTFTGTLNGSSYPIWNTNGIYSSGAGSVVPNIVLANTNLSAYTARTWLSIINPITPDPSDWNIADTANYGMQYGGGAGQGMNMGIGYKFTANQSGSYANYTSVGASIPSYGVFSGYGIAMNGTTLTHYQNATADATASTGTYSSVTDSNSIRLMAFNGGAVNDRGINGTMAVFMDFRVGLNSTQYASVYTLYKQTLGLGLALS
jgi:hypothetical protein